MLEKTEPNSAFITTLTSVREHPNADNLQIASVAGEQVIVGKKSQENDVVIYFDSNLCLSREFLHNNNLYSNPELNKDTSKKGYFNNSGRVKAQTFRGEKSYGFVCPVSFLDFTSHSIFSISKGYNIGTEFNKVNGVEICKKYIIKNKVRGPKGIGKIDKSKHPKTNMWIKHWDTAHFKRNIEKIPPNRMIYIEEKEHGTSWIAVNALVYKDLSLFEKVLKFFKVDINMFTWMPIHSSRRVMLTFKPKHYKPYHKGSFREKLFDKVKGSMHKGESLYGELVGYTDTGSFIQKNFPYGCKEKESSAMLYRVTFTNTDGKNFDLGREYVYYRAKQIGLRPPTLFEKYYYTGNKEELISKVDSYTDGNSAICDNTIREGVVIWFEGENGEWCCLKNKSYAFLEKESKQKDSPTFEDIEEEG